MANKEQIQKALDELWTRYGNTLSMLTDAIDKIDEKDQRISELEKLVLTVRILISIYQHQQTLLT